MPLSFSTLASPHCCQAAMMTSVSHSLRKAWPRLSSSLRMSRKL